jgi:phenylalanyl-tRNA synthetase beta chain
MRLPVSWLRDFVKVTASAEAIAETLALRGFEVASIEAAPALPNVPWQRSDGPDAVIDLEVTANRPDCLGLLGLAREVATAYDLPVNLPSTDAGAVMALDGAVCGESQRLAVTLEDADLCPRYAAAVADIGATGVAPSPPWLAGRLHAAGVRPISAIVDITNYVLLELGHPMHAFDLARLEGAELRIRRARPGEAVTTLDGIPRTLEADMLVIADARRPQAVGGVMGGSLSEVSPATTAVAFESAYFKPTSVRRTSKRLGLRTEASFRFERGADINLPVTALRRAIWLMEHIGAGRISGPIVDRYPTVRRSGRVRLRRTHLGQLLGAAVPDREAERIMTRLGLAPTPVDGGWDVEVPTFRVDISREVDLIEEIGRHHGFDRIPPTFPVMTSPAEPPDPRVPRDRLVRRVMTAAGFSEAVTFGFVETGAAEPFASGGSPTGLVRIANPLSAKFEVLRPSLLPGLIDSIGRNRRHGRRDAGLFEIGMRFTALGETRGVGIARTGASAPEHWSGTPRQTDFFDIKGVVEQLCLALGVAVRFEPTGRAFLLPERAATVVAHDGSDGALDVGTLGQIAPGLLEIRGLPAQDELYVAELDLDALSRASGHARRVGETEPSGGDEVDEAVRPLPRYPSVVRDLSIVVAETLPAEVIRGTIQAAGRRTPAPLVAMTFFDRYRGRGVPAGSVSLSLRLTFQAADRTLTDDEVQVSFQIILSTLAAEHGAVQR